MNNNGINVFKTINDVKYEGDKNILIKISNSHAVGFAKKCVEIGLTVKLRINKDGKYKVVSNDVNDKNVYEVSGTDLAQALKSNFFKKNA